MMNYLGCSCSCFDKLIETVPDNGTVVTNDVVLLRFHSDVKVYWLFCQPATLKHFLHKIVEMVKV